MKTKASRSWWRVAGLTFAALVMVSAVLLITLRRRIPPELMKDIRAGISVRHISDPEQRLHGYFEARYGPLSDPDNRQKVFLDFFNIDHIKALQLMVRHMPESQRQASIQATAKWLEDYRNSLTEDQRAALCAQFQTGEGRAMLRQATAQHNSQDSKYRGQIKPVISQLLTTISQIQGQ